MEWVRGCQRASGTKIVALRLHCWQSDGTMSKLNIFLIFLAYKRHSTWILLGVGIQNLYVKDNKYKLITLRVTLLLTSLEAIG